VPEDIGLFEAIYSQRAIRKLKPDPVSDELVHKLIEAATKAPSGGNSQSWAFVVIREMATKEKIAEWYLDAWTKTYVAGTDSGKNLPDQIKRVYGAANHLANHMKDVPVFILVCGRNAPPAGSGHGGGFYGSLFPAVQNLLLAAQGLGLGASLTTLHKMHDQELKDLLDIPDSVETVALIPIGHPIGKYGPTTRRPVEEVSFQERWDSSKD
jgi:nitroreductase